jgi:iron complex transport system ATP-binding protein
VITARDVRFAYDGTPVVADVSLDACDGSVLGLIGPNGSGKTTLLRILYAALAPHAGLVEVDGAELRALRPVEVAKRIAVVAQESPPEIPISVTDLVLLGRSPATSAFRSFGRADHEAAAAALTRVGVRHLAERSFTALSGGEKQRVLIARALVQDCAHLLLDEPTNHLDIRYQHEILALLRSLDVASVVVLHDLNLAARYCDQLVLLDRGEIIASGATDAVLTPEVLEPVYGVRVRCLHDGNDLHLAFSPQVNAASV